MDLRQRQVSLNEADLAGIGGHQWLIYLLVPFLAVWALEIAELNNGDNSIFGTSAVETLGGNFVAPDGLLGG